MGNEVNIPRMAALFWMSGEAANEQAGKFMMQAAQAFQVTPDRFGGFMFAGTEQAREVIIAAHHQARQAIKAERPSLPVGLTMAMQDLQAVEGGEAVRDMMRWELQDVFLEAAQDDSRRLAYYQTALSSVAECLHEGLDVRGYFAWSAFDNFEWMLGYRPKFGIIAVNRKTQERIVKPSAKWLGQVAKVNRLQKE